jgi:hypothetical protein
MAIHHHLRWIFFNERAAEFAYHVLLYV